MRDGVVAKQSSGAADTPRYSILIPEETLTRAAAYGNDLRIGHRQPGGRLRDCLQDLDLQNLSARELLGRLIDTKYPQIFAELSVAGDGSDWNLTELGLLGDVSIAVPVTIYDDGHHSQPRPHQPSFCGTLVFSPGALLRNGRGFTPADWNETTTPEGELFFEGYLNLYRRRLLPVLQYINHRAAKPRSALVTLPGLGCGQFAGPFQGQLGVMLQSVLEHLLKEYGPAFANLKAIYFDPYSECESSRTEIHGISLLVRPLKLLGDKGNSQLCRPIAYQEDGDDFSACHLYSLVAWDHVSWPGNDFFIDSRATDDGVKAAATNSMAVLTGVEGLYDTEQGKYRPPAPYRNWAAVVSDRQCSEALRLWNALAVWQSVEP